MAEYMQFSEIVTKVERGIKHYQSSMQGLVKHVINMVYLTEMLQVDDLYPLYWLHAYLRMRLHAPKTITDISAADPGVVTSVAHGFIGHEVITLWDIVGTMESLNCDNELSLTTWHTLTGYFIVKYIDADTFSLLDQNEQDVDTSVLAYTSGGTIFHQGWNSSFGMNRINSIGIHDGNPLREMTTTDFLKNPDKYFSDSQTTPYCYFLLQFFNSGAEYNTIVTCPGASENKIIYYEFEGRGDPLELDADVPNLPFEFHPAIVAGAIARLAENNVQVEYPGVWPGIYKMQLNSLKEFNRKFWQQHEPDMRKEPYLL